LATVNPDRSADDRFIYRLVVPWRMADENSQDDSSGLFGRLTTLATLVQAGRAFKSGNTGRAVLLVGSVLLGRRNPRLGYLIQLADTVNELRKRLA
jgi:hypothetical protein